KTGARRGFLILEREGVLRVEAMSSVDPDIVKVGLGISLDESSDLPITVVQYVARTCTPLVLADAFSDARFTGDPFILARHLKSILCVPLSHQGRLSGVLYLENDLAEDAFNRDRVDLLEILCAQAATAVENSFLYSHIREVGLELQRANNDLEQQ